MITINHHHTAISTALVLATFTMKHNACHVAAITPRWFIAIAVPRGTHVGHPQGYGSGEHWDVVISKPSLENTGIFTANYSCHTATKHRGVHGPWL